MKNEFNDKEFDDALRAKSLEHHPVPSPDVWGRIDHSIADAEAKKSRRKLFYFRWFIGILLILSSSLLIYILNNSSKKRQISLNENVSKVKEGNQIISKSTTGNIQNNKDMLSNAKNEFRNDNKILTNKNVNKIKDTVVNKVETITNNTVNKNSIATNNSITAKKITDNNSHNISYSANDIDTSAKEILHTFPVNMDSSKSYQQLFIKSDSVLTSSDSSHQLIPLMVEKKDTLMNEHPLSKNEMDSILKTKKNRWSFGISVLPMLTSIRGSNSQNSPTSNSAFEPTKEINQPFGIIAGANILYDLNSKKISIYGAINYYERFVHSEFSNIYV